MKLDSTPQWYAVRTRSRAEKVVRDQLRSRGIEPLLPLVTKMSQWKDRKKRVEWPLFPGYCFARFTVGEKLSVLQSPGVVEIIGSANDRPEPIPETEILALQQLMASRQPYDPHPSLEEGMMVEVTRGPLMGIRGTLVRKGPRSRLVLAINLIRQGAAVDIESEDIVPVHPQPESIHQVRQM